MIPHTPEGITPSPARNPEKKAEPTLYERNTAEVKNKLRQFGFGPTVEFLTPEGIDRPAYLAFARERLFGQEYRDGVKGKELPQKIGEVEIPENVRQHVGNMLFHDIYLNLGYGHFRPANSLNYFVELLGGTPKDTFLGGPENVLPEKDLLNDRLLRAALRAYTRESLKKALAQGMIDTMPEIIDPDPKATRRLHHVVTAIKTAEIVFTKHEKLTKREKIKAIRQMWKDPEKVIADILAIQETDTLETMHRQGQATKPVVGGAIARLIKKYQEEYPEKDSYVFSTWTFTARLVGGYLRKMGQRPFVAGHFQPDSGIVLGGYTKEPQTYVESKETAEKWGYLQGLDGEAAPNTVVLDGYITPLSIFERSQITELRKQASQEGQPLTVLALASGVSPVQLGVFKEFIKNGEQEMRDGKLRMVIQCGAQEDPSLGMGMTTYTELHKLVEEKGLQDSVVLHVAPTPKAAVDFFEAATWAPIPLAVLVKGAEAARMSHALNIPVIPTGTVGSHETWNIANTVLHSPEMVVFPQSVGQQFRKNIETIFPHDPLIQHHPEYLSQILEQTIDRTATNMQQLIDMVHTYIQSGHMTDSSAAAMLHLLSDMISRKHPQKKS